MNLASSLSIHFRFSEQYKHLQGFILSEQNKPTAMHRELSLTLGPPKRHGVQ